MSATFFLTDLPAGLGEATLRKFLRDELFVSVSFRDSPAGTVAMVEARNAQEAQCAAAEFARITCRTASSPTVVAFDTPEGHQLQLIFAVGEERAQHACRRDGAFSACVLIVGDDPMCLTGMQELVSIHLPHVCLHVAESSDSALALNRTREFDAILSDVRMPGLDEYAFVMEMKGMRPHTPVVLMTAAADVATLITKSGAVSFIRKPADRKYCVTALQHAMMYSSLSKLVANATQRSQRSIETSEGLRWMAKAVLAESLSRWHQR